MQKGPYFDNVQYISPLPEGYMQAASNIGRSYGDAIKGVGQDIGAGIKQYQKNQEETGVLGAQIGQYIKADPTIQNNLDPKLLQKFTSDKATLKDHRDLFAAIGTNMLMKKKLSDETAARQQQELTAAQISELARNNKERETYINAIGANTTATDEGVPGEVDWNGVSQTMLDAGFDPYSSKITGGMTAARLAAYGGPTGQSININGRPVDIVKTGPNPDDVQVLPDRPKPVVNSPDSPIGKLWSDYYNAKTPEEEQSISDEIDKIAKTDPQGKALTESQASALSYSLRMRMNEKVLSTVDYDPSAFFNGTFTPLERMKGTARKQYEAARSNWISANLRKESGAAISADEYDKADQQYFPQSGDPVKVVEQKKQLRRQAELSMSAAIGPDGPKLLDKFTYKTEQTQTEAQSNELDKFTSAADAEAAFAAGKLKPGQTINVWDPATRKYRPATF